MPFTFFPSYVVFSHHFMELKACTKRVTVILSCIFFMYMLLLMKWNAVK